MKQESLLIMIVDDTLEDLYINKRMLVKSGFSYSLIEFKMATDALEYFQQNVLMPDRIPDIVLLDIHMPRMNGFELLEQLEKLPAETFSSCRFFIISSSFDERDVQMSGKSRLVTTFYEKPLTGEAIREIFFYFK